MSKFVLTAQLQLQAPTNTRQIISQLRSQLAGGLNVPITVTGGAKAQKQVNNVTNATKEATSAAQNMGRTFGLAFKRFAAFTVASRAVSLFTNTLANAVEEAIDFQREIIKISQVTGKAVRDLQGLEKTIFRLAKTLGVNSKELLSTTRILSQAGIQARDLEVALAALAKTTLAPTFEDISKTAEGAIAILAQFKQGVGALEGQLGSINAVAGQFAVESGDLIGAIRRTGGVFQEAGGDLEEFLGLFTSIRATTRESSESIATGLRTIFTRLQRPRTLEFLRQYGVELTDLEGKFVGPYEAVRRLNSAIGGLEQGDITFIKIAEEIAGFRQIGKVIPLLKEFELAERARAAAIDGTSSLTEDAAKAQQALAVQILKVKQEFQELIQGIANTSTFQAFVKTSLTLASALIKIADAIKPLIPLLAAMAAFKFARGLGGFAAGIGGALRGAAGKNQGGKILAFSRGGMVPGQGNRDTVPAMLQPGEFVIRKSSVNKMGAGTLAAMNSNGYNRGGRVTTPGEARDLLGLKKGSNEWDILSKATKAGSQPGAADARSALFKKASLLKARKRRQELAGKYPGGAYKTLPGAIGGFFMMPEQGDAGYKLGADVPFNTKKGKGAILKGSEFAEFYPDRTDLPKNKAVADLVSNASRVALKTGVAKAVPKIANALNITGEITPSTKSMLGGANAISQDEAAQRTVSGYLFEGIIQGITGAKLAGKGASFDFPSVAGSKEQLKKLFTGAAGASVDRLMKADAKRSRSAGVGTGEGTLVDKLRQDIEKGDLSGLRMASRPARTPTATLLAGDKKRKGFASGGSVGSDTVPALLTPGEFVVNKSAAKSIGYGNLSSMNKSGVAKFNKGGIVGVQRFAEGGGVMGGGAIQFAVASAAIGTLTTGINALGTEADGTKNAFGRVTDVLISWGTAAAAAIYALKSFGFAVSAKGIMEFFGKGPNSLGGLLGKAKSAISAGASGTEMIGPAQGKTGEVFKGLQNSIAGVANKIKGSGLTEGLSQMKSGMTEMFPTFSKTGSLFTSIGTQLSTFAGFLKASSLAIVQETAKRVMNTKMGSNIGRGIKNFGAGRKGTGAFRMDGFKKDGITRKAVSMKGEDSLMWRMGKRTRGGINRVKGVGRGAGNLLGRIPGVGKLGRGAMTVGRGAMGLMGMGGGGGAAAGGAAAAGGGLMAIAGPAAAAAAAVALLSAGLNAAFDAQGKYNEAIRQGNVAEAEKYAVLKNVPGIIQLFGEGASEAWATMMSAFGGDSVKLMKQRAKMEALAGKLEKEKADLTRKANQAMKEFTRGTATATQALQAQTAAFINSANLAQAERETADQMRAEKSGAMGSFGRGALRIGTLGIAGLLGVESGGQRNRRIDKEADDLEKKSTERLAADFENLRNSTAPLQKRFILSGQSFDEFIASSNLAGKLTKEQAEKLEGDYNANRKAIQANIKFIEAMNFGLRDVTAAANAAAVGMDIVAAAGEGGFNNFEASLQTLELAMTSSAGNISGADMDNAIADLENSMRQFGASEEQIAQSTGTVRGMQQAQANVPNALEAAKVALKNEGTSTDPESVRKALKGGLLEGLEGPAKEKLAAAIDNMKIDEEMRIAIKSGNIDKILEKTIDPVAAAAAKQQFAILKKRAEMENKLIDSLKNRAAQEAEYISAQKAAIDTQLEAGKLFESFGGAKLTSGQQLGARIGQANLALGNAGVAGLSGGGAGDIRKVMGDIQRNAAQQNERANVGIMSRGRGAGAQGGFAGAAGFDADKRDELKEANKAIVDFTKQRISLIQEELKIAQQKNKAEKDALDKLLGGDIEGFLEGQLASAAGAALRSGDAGVASAFGAGALGAGFKTLDGQGLDDKSMERAASLALSSVGVSDPRAAQVMAGNTAEEEALKSQGRDLAQVLGDAAQQQATLEKMDVTTSMVVVKAQEMKIDQFNKNPEGALAGVEGFSKGGVVYASNGGFFKRRGTDSVPAMLTPGEFVMNRKAVNSGNNLSTLQSMNSGGAVGGGEGSAGLQEQFKQNVIDPLKQIFENSPLATFSNQFEQSVQKLMDFQLNVKVDPTNVTVNFQGGSFLSTLKEDIKNELLEKVKSEIGNAKFNESGDVKSKPGGLA